MSLRDDLTTFAAECRAALEAGGPRPKWPEPDLSDADLAAAVFCGAVLRDADPRDADLSGADLEGAALMDAYTEAQALAQATTQRARNAREEYRDSTVAVLHTTDPAAEARARKACAASQAADEEARVTGNALVRLRQAWRMAENSALPLP